MEETVKTLNNTGEVIQRLFTNFKKDSASRKTTKEYFETRLAALEEAWTEFETADTVFRSTEGVDNSHEYFTSGFYDKVVKLYTTYKEVLVQEINKFKENQTATQSSSNEIQQRLPTLRSPNEILANRQQAIFSNICVMLDEVVDNLGSHSSQFLDTMVRQIEHQISTVQQLHEKLCVAEAEYNIQDYVAKQSQISNKLVQIKERQAGITEESSAREPTHSLPKVTIPRFDGDYLKWRQFFELFSEMVDNQPLPPIKKMFYLKMNISGEAEKLIRHLSPTGDNYETAWKMLQERYNNMRILTSTLLEKLLSQGKVPADNPSASAIKSLHDTTCETMSALKALGVDIQMWDPLIIHILIKKLDKGTHMQYEQSLEKPRELPTLKQFLGFLEAKFQSLEAVGHRDRPTSSKACSSIVSSSNNYKKCISCHNHTHPLFKCERFLNLAPAKRLQLLQTNKYCINCMKPGHFTKTCASRNCLKCEKKHNTLLHIEGANNEDSLHSPSTVAAVNQRGPRQGYVLLATAKVRITARNGLSEEFRAILDSGSQVNIVSERLVKRLAISPAKASLCIEGIGKRSKNASQRVNVTLQSRMGHFSTLLEAYVLPSIVPDQPTRQIDISSWPIPNTIQLADPDFNDPGKIDILLGAEHYFNLLLAGQIEFSTEQPVLKNTKLGWIASGKLNLKEDSSAICAIHAEEEIATSELVQQFWKIDGFEEESNLTIAEQLCETQFVQTTVRNSDGRFVVRLPFSQGPVTLGQSKAVALARFHSLERRLAKDTMLKQQYTEFMDQYQALGHMTLIKNEDVKSPHFYIPHHCVLRPESSTTKLRVVFDASAKSSSGLSLNDILYAGPTVQGDLFGMLLRFRLPRFVFCTDIEKMYRQILVDPADRHMQLIFWRTSQSEPEKIYKLNTVTYGTSSAPYLATKCLQQLAEQNMERYSLGAPTLRNDFYVDDCMSGSNSLTTAKEMQKQLTLLLQEGGFKLRKWCANHSQLLQGIPPEDVEINLDFENDSTKVLGLIWIPKSDLFGLKAVIQEGRAITKRSVTSDIARIFDPLGIAGPVVVAAKIFIQKLWLLQITWDEQLPAEMRDYWFNFRETLKTLNNTHTKRHMFDGETPISTEIHTFVDASEKAYGAAVYLRSRIKDGRTLVRLLCAKSRIAPLKRLTLPRLELCAATLGAELTTKVQKELHYKNNRVFLWTDSEIVLYWINSSTSALRSFVANRITTIQQMTTKDQWRHVSSKDNPADLISRGLRPDKLMSNSLWFYGPIFLHANEAQWPKAFNKETQAPTHLEFKQSNVVAATNVKSVGEFVYTINHRNSFHSLQRIVVYIQRFIENSRKSKNIRPPTISPSTQELALAVDTIVKAMQAADFQEEIRTLQNKKGVQNSSSISSLSPFLDKNGVLRVGGRLEASILSYEEKHPIILPYNDQISKLILTTLHTDNRHCGPQALLAISRQRFWIIKGKSMARNIVQNCVRCTRAKPKLLGQIMGNLPANRVTPGRPFITSGVDYCGPFWVHYRLRGKRPHKVYIAVFCCFATKAVHMEVVTDLTTLAFIGALKRFIGRRGRCQTIYSDNATNFVGARNQLLSEELTKAIYTKESQEAIARACSEKGIEFKFIPPRSPHFGGLWEAAVKSAKKLLLSGASTASLTYEELETVVIEVEAILNSRPLTPISSSAEDLTALTPGHFIIGEPLIAQVDSRAIEQSTSLATRWRLVSQIKHKFWERWSSEYLHQLQEKHKWKEASQNVKKGDMVIIKEDNTPVMKWPLGRISEVHQGKDGIIRVVDVKTASGIARRSIHRLAPLFKEDSESIQIQEQSRPRQRPAASSEVIPSKRRKPHTNQVMLTILALMLLVPAVLCKPSDPVILGNNLSIQQFRAEPGIYFEGIGTTKLITAEWKMIVFYDLETFKHELKALSAGISALHQACTMIRNRAMCDTVCSNLNSIAEELYKEEEVFSTGRAKRAAFNIVGNVARSLFGLLDADYAEEMAKTISKAKEDKGHIVELLKNQTSIIDSTINIIKQDEVEAKTRVNNLQEQIKNIFNTLRKDDEQISTTQALALLASHLTLMAINLQRTETEIINVLTDAHHGRISPLLLSPHQLKNELYTIKAHLPTARTIPIKDDNLIELYKLMDAKGAVTKGAVIFEVIIPLVDQQTLEVFKIIPVPTNQNKTLIAIAPDSTFLAVNPHRDEYIPMTTDELNKCFVSKTDEYICKNLRSRLKTESARYSCEIQLFLKRNSNNCKLKRIEGNTVWTPMHQQNKWIFSIATSIEMSAVCDIEPSLVTLNGSGILQIAPSCVLRTQDVTIHGQFGASNVIHTSYVNFQGLASLKPSNEDIFNFTDQPSTLNTNQLDTLQNQLRESTRIHVQEIVNSSNPHQHIVSYSSLVLSVACLIIFAIWKWPCNRNQSPPRAAPRNATSQFSVENLE